MSAAEPIRIADVLTVVVGGFAGSVSRYAITLVLPGTVGIDWPLLLVNLVGAFCLGLLIEVLSRRGSAMGETTTHRRLRLLLGTGFLGGFTTYSALAVGTLAPGSLAILQLVVIVLGGLVAAALGMALGVLADRRQR